MKIADYFSGTERSLRRIKGAKISGQIISLASDDYNGLLRCRVLFWDESYLELWAGNIYFDMIMPRIIRR